MGYSANSDEITRDYFDSLLIETKYLDSTIPTTDISLYGAKFSTPVMTAALSHLGNTVPNGMIIYAEGACKSNALHFVGMSSDEELEQIVATGAKVVKIIKPHADNDVIFKKLEHASKIGCFAVGMDIDHSFSADGNYDNVMGFPMKAKSSTEIKEFISATKLPFIIKGVLSPFEAEKCLACGAAGIQVSHHHGMINYAVPPLMMLPDIIKAVGNEIPVFIDCGFESGCDVFKALALGAKGVSLGRHLMPFLKGGSDAVSAEINRITGELAGYMARTGIAGPDKMDPSVIHKRTF